MIEYVIPLLAEFCSPELMRISLYPVFALAFISIIPDLFRQFIEWR